LKTLEGIVSKRGDSANRSGRSPDWLKMKNPAAPAVKRQRLRELGWIEGRTVAIEYRWAEGHSERFPEIAAELVRLKVDVIVTTGGAVL